MSSEGKLIVVSGPSGVGKDTIVEYFLKDYGVGCKLSVSATTRPPRQGETTGVDYFFISEDEFLSYIKTDQLLEYTRYNGNYYGTLKSNVVKQLKEGINVILIIETDGAQQIAHTFPEAVLIFIMPPSFDELKKRIYSRSLDSEKHIENRLKIALREIEEGKKYRYSIVNDDIYKTVEQLKEIIRKETTPDERKD